MLRTDGILRLMAEASAQINRASLPAMCSRSLQYFRSQCCGKPPKVNTVVIGQFAFQHDVVVNAVSKAGSESEVISAGLRKIQVVKKNAGFEALLREK